jgi:hypothetical protein
MRRMPVVPTHGRTEVTYWGCSALDRSRNFTLGYEEYLNIGLKALIVWGGILQLSGLGAMVWAIVIWVCGW